MNTLALADHIKTTENFGQPLGFGMLKTITLWQSMQLERAAVTMPKVHQDASCVMQLSRQEMLPCW